ncbi:MAG TPA: hypothetical protein EYO71_00535 [Rhodospirillales bacterium]|nr:hypothetical protein [Rhodospirillales bacterium]
MASEHTVRGAMRPWTVICVEFTGLISCITGWVDYDRSLPTEEKEGTAKKHGVVGYSLSILLRFLLVPLGMKIFCTNAH